METNTRRATTVLLSGEPGGRERAQVLVGSGWGIPRAGAERALCFHSGVRGWMDGWRKVTEWVSFPGGSLQWCCPGGLWRAQAHCLQGSGSDLPGG